MLQEFFYVNAGLTGVTPTGLVERVRNCVRMLTGNAAFATPDPKLPDMTDLADVLDQANQSFAFTRSKLDKQARDTAFSQLKGMMHKLAGYVQATSSGDRELIMSAGMDVRRKPSPTGQLAAPANVQALVTPYAGRLELRWGGVRNKRLYELYITEVEGPEAVWELVTMTTKNRFTVNDLASDTVYYFRVVALGIHGASPASDIAKAKAA